MVPGTGLIPRDVTAGAQPDALPPAKSTGGVGKGGTGFTRFSSHPARNQPRPCAKSARPMIAADGRDGARRGCCGLALSPRLFGVQVAGGGLPKLFCCSYGGRTKGIEPWTSPV